MNKTLKLSPSHIDIPDNCINILPLNIKINPIIDAIIPGVNMFGDYDYWAIKSNLPIRKEEIDIVGKSIAGIADVKWLDSYECIFGIKKSPYFKSGGDDGVVQEIISAIHGIYESGSCENGTCSCAAEYEHDFIEMALESIADIQGKLTTNSLLKNLINSCTTKHIKAA